MNQDYSSNSSDSYSDNDSYPRRHDDRKIQAPGNSQQEEPSGSLFSLKFTPTVPFEEYEIWAFVEDTMRLSLVDLSAFRNLNGSMTGVVVGQFEEPVTVNRLKKLHGRKFKDSPIEARLFVNLGSFQQYCRTIAELRIREANIDTKTPPPHVYVMNFPENDETSVKNFFERCGSISFVKRCNCNNGTCYFTLFFVTEAGAMLACRTFDGYVYKNRSLTVAPLFKNAAERSFAVHHAQDPKWLRLEIENFGKIEKFQYSNETKDAFVLMEKLEDAKAACVLLNKKFDNSGVQIKTNFIDYQYFLIGDSHF